MKTSLTNSEQPGGNAERFGPALTEEKPGRSNGLWMREPSPTHRWQPAERAHQVKAGSICYMKVRQAGMKTAVLMLPVLIWIGLLKVKIGGNSFLNKYFLLIIQ